MARRRGIIAAGHPLTAEAAAAVLREGGNAFDAALAAVVTACVSEPVLASLGGGGFLLARPVDAPARVYDFFVQTPRRQRPATDVDFGPVVVNFGTATQEFHIGRGAVAVPGMVRGLFEVHEDLGTMPITELMTPAITHAKQGVRIDAFHAYVFRILSAIYMATPESGAVYGSPTNAGRPVSEGETLYQPALADVLEAIAEEGEALFYRGEIASRLVRDMQDGGHISGDDLSSYRVERRVPLQVDYHGTGLLMNPPPSSGGLLIAFALKLLESNVDSGLTFGSPEHIELLARTMDATSQARVEAHIGDPPTRLDPARVLDPGYLATWKKRISAQPKSQRGTTHISIVDALGNVAALSVSNGEGSAYVIPGTGITLNNMLGEADLNPGGFHRWPVNARMTSMMAPTIATGGEGQMIATGSGGSNRLRTAIFQVLFNLLDLGMSARAAVMSPRVHYEDGLLSVEGGFDLPRIAPVLAAFPRHQLWQEQNMFFGGAHTVVATPGGFSGAGDSRRGGVCIAVE